MMQALDWAYDKAINGIPGAETAEELGEDYKNESGSLDDHIDSLIRWQIAKCSASGFLSGLGGVVTLPIAVPANIASVLYVQIRMIAAIAHMRGYDVRSDQVKTLVYLSLVGGAIKDVLKEVGVKIGSKLTESAIKSISGKTLTAINQKVGFRLVTKFGEKGAVNLGKAIPLIGGLIGGTVDGISTNVVGESAKKVFTERHV